MSLKQRLQGWLEVEKPEKPIAWDEKFKEYTQQYAKEATVEFERIVKQMKPVNCINCGKLLIEGRDSIYTNSKGQKFHSHECIDEFAAKDDKTPAKPKKTKKGKK